MYQAVTQEGIDAHGDGWVHPSFYLLYGCYRRIEVKEPLVASVPDDVQLGVALWEDMLPLSEAPTWDPNEQGSAFVANLGSVVMKPPDFTRRWFAQCYQTVLWIGTATPGQGSQQKQKTRDRSRGKCKGKGKCKTSGKKTKTSAVPTTEWMAGVRPWLTMK